MRLAHSNALILSIVLLLGSVGGCGDRPELAPVSGHVTLDGKPLNFGFVLFSPAKGIPAQGEIQEGGNFQMASKHPADGALVGPHEVSVLCFQGHNPKVKAKSTGGEVSMGASLIPVRYTRSGMSGLTVEVPPEGLEDYHIELSSKGPRR